jgi:hypothetical protein
MSNDTKVQTKVNEIKLPDGLELVGIFKFKDEEGRRAIRIKITSDVEELIVQKVDGENNKMIIAVRRGVVKCGSVTVPKEKILLPK